jgi:magnesium transporter
MAGNSGTQSLAVTVRLLNGDPLTKKERWRLVNKEIGIGFANGGALAMLSFGGIGAYLCLTGESAVFAFAVSGCIGGALWCAMTLSAAAGTLIPLTLDALKLDPAVASGPLITTLNDLSAVVIYYGLAWLFLLQIGGF